MLKYLVILILPLYSFGQKELERFYSGNLTLEKEQISKLSNDNIQNGSNYQKALGHFQLGVLSRQDKKNLTAWKHYDNAYYFLKSSDTVDYILESAILRLQGAIAQDYQLHEVRAEKYLLAVNASIQCDKRNDGNYRNHRTRELSTLYNLGRAYNDAGKSDLAIKTFSDILDKVDERSKYRARAYRESAMIYKEMDMYAESQANFELAEEVQISSGDARKMKMWIYHDWASLHKEKGDLQEEEMKLRKALESYPTFRTKMDLGECLLLQGKNNQALAVLEQAEIEYHNQRLSDENIKVYDLLMQLSENKLEYAIKRGDELQKYAEDQKQIKEETTSIAFKNAIKEIERNKAFENTINQLFRVLFLIGWSALFIFSTGFIIRILKKRKVKELFPK